MAEASEERPRRVVKRASLEVALIAVNAALYAAVGLLTYLGLFAPVFGTVRFWPAVVVPAVFSVLFTPWIGGVGAAIGIFISDMLVHGNPLLSLSVGVPSNFLGFYILGRLARSRRRTWAASLGVQAIPLAAAGLLYWFGLVEEVVAYVFLAVAAAVFLLGAYLALSKPRYSSLLYASAAGLMVGSAVIGVGLWAFSQFFLLPTGESSAPIVAALVWFLWTYLTEIPFLAFLLPPIVYAVAKAMPERVREVIPAE